MSLDIEPISSYVVWADFRKGTVCTNTKLSVCCVLLNQLPLAFCYALLAAFIFEIHCTSEENHVDTYMMAGLYFPLGSNYDPGINKGSISLNGHAAQCRTLVALSQNVFITNTNLELTHVYLCILACTCVFLCILMCTYLYSCILVYTLYTCVYLVYSCIPCILMYTLYTRVYSCIPCILMYTLYTHVYSCILVYTRVYLVYSCILVYTRVYLVYSCILVYILVYIPAQLILQPQYTNNPQNIHEGITCFEHDGSLLQL